MKKTTQLVTSFYLLFFTILSINAQDLNLKLMSFNIQQPHGTNWESRRANAAYIINTTQADVIGTQEAIDSQRTYLIEQTGYAWYGTGRDGGDSGEGSWILYKGDKYSLDTSNSGSFWMSDTPNVPSSFGGSYNRICTYVRLIEKSSGQGFYVFNVHFPTSGFFDARFKSMRLVAERMATRAVQSDPVYATGDFNSTEGDAVTLWMKNGVDNPIKCRDTHRDIDPTGPVNTGFGTKFDYIYSPNNTNYTTQASWVIESPKASDHKPIVAQVRYENQITPPNSNPLPIPGKIEAEDYANAFQVELENTTDTGGGKNVGYLDSNDWVEYKVLVAGTGNYLFDLRIASNSEGGKLNVLINGEYNQTIVIPVTGGWQIWKTINKAIDLPKGIHTIRLEVVEPGFNLNWYNFVSNSTGSLSIPGKIEAENYTAEFGTELENTTDVGGGKNVGYLDVNDILEYNVQVSGTDHYNFDIRVASLDKSGSINVIVDNQSQKTINLPVTGGWQNWQTLTSSIYLTQGNHQLKFEVVNSGFNLNWYNFYQNGLSNITIQTGFKAPDLTLFYPNPATNYIFFTDISDWTVYTISGKKVLSGNSKKAAIGVLHSGMYLIRVNNGEVKKILIN
ncbi:carbohydrate-binding protein [Aquimarina sp. M1]